MGAGKLLLTDDPALWRIKRPMDNPKQSRPVTDAFG
jgi:hypothetical protein